MVSDRRRPTRKTVDCQWGIRGFIATGHNAMHCNRVVIAVVWIIFGVHQVFAQDTHIWLSDRMSSPESPGQAVLTSVSGAERTVFIWAQPEGVKSITQLSLNFLVAPGGGASVDLGESVIFNPQLGSSKRYQFVNDSSEGLDATGSPEAITGLLGIRYDASAYGITYDGFGGVCGSDPYCDTDTAGDDAWLIGAVTYSVTGAPLDDAELVLQIGQFGISHEGESTADTEVVFGNDAGWYLGSTGREANDANPEASITVVAPTVNTWTGVADENWHLATWSEATVPTATHEVNVSAGHTLSVTEPQNAHQTNVTSGRLHVASGGALSGDIDIAGGQQLSGGGWIAADVEYGNNAVHAIDASETLQVFGEVSIGNSVSLQVTDTYAQAEQTWTTFDMLEASGISGSFDASDAGDASGADYLGNGIFLKSFVEDSQSVTVTLQNLPGDYNGDGDVDAGDGDVDASDYLVWSGAFGGTGDFQPADGNLDGVVDAADYTIWKDNVGNTAVELGTGIGTGFGSTIPEPTAWLVLLVGLAVGWGSTRGLRSRVS